MLSDLLGTGPRLTGEAFEREVNAGMWNRRLYVLVCAGLFMSWSYRAGLRHLRDDSSGWTAFVTLWLPTAIGLGLVIAYGMPWLTHWWTDRRRRRHWR
jgi:hypothetical protein